MISGAVPWHYMVVFATLVMAAMIAGVTIGRRLGRQPLPQPAPRRFDGEPHILTRVGSDGRANPGAYERFPDYPSALSRQRELVGRGIPAVVTHAESGEVRLDLAQLLGPFHRISL